ncbi:ATP-binding protein [Cytobacillus firmus]|uniref:magnesium chelatase subunit ChlI family protein n=1 Tax=Cytobacillus firmus TaxID=1399 RepID=UPI002867C755|nr:ATP-binding protein [Cytobacillus firmus]
MKIEIVLFKVSFILIGAMNPCPCGYAGSNTLYCTCSPKQIVAYQNKLSGPLRDRFDINLSLSPVNLRSVHTSKEESSSAIRKRVEAARKRQYKRYGREIVNGRVSYDTLLTSPLNADQQRKLQQFSYKKNCSNRTQIKIMGLARTISDLQGSVGITDQSIWEAVKLNSLAERKDVTGIKMKGI